MSRRPTGRATSAQTRFSRVAVQHHLSHKDQALEHARVRNRLALQVLTYLAVLASRAALDPSRIAEHKARYQNAKGYRVRQQPGTYDFVWDITRGYAVYEGAHYLPCSLSYGNADISRLGQTPGEREGLRAPFGDVHVLPAIFNDADQRAEDGGLRRTFERAARKLVALHPQGAEPDFALIRHVYIHVWQAGADLTYMQCLDDLEPLMAKEVLRRYRVGRDQRTGLDDSHFAGDDPELLAAQFYAGMHEIIGRYRTVTAEERPSKLSDDELRHNVWRLAQARAGLTHSRKKLELAD